MSEPLTQRMHFIVDVPDHVRCIDDALPYLAQGAVVGSSPIEPTLEGAMSRLDAMARTLKLVMRDCLGPDGLIQIPPAQDAHG